MSFEVRGLSCGYGGRALVKDINMKVAAGEVVCVLGPNGAGKTTFFKTILGYLPCVSGEVLWNEKALALQNARQRAQVLAYVPQTHAPPFPYSVRDVVAMGRTAHLKPFQSPTASDYELCDEMLGKLKLSHLCDKAYTRISGGERQMVLIARALVQEPSLLLMDEPTSNLDYGNQVKVLQQVLDMASEGLAVVMTTHSPEHAAVCAGRVALFQTGKPILLGTPDEVICKEVLREAYGVDVKMFEYLDGRGRRVISCAPVLGQKSERSALC